MSSFTRKNLVHEISRMRRNKLLKGLTLFFLGASATLLLVNAQTVVNANVSNVVYYMKQLFLTSDGSSTGTVGVLINGSGSIQASSYCNSGGTLCKSIESLATTGYVSGYAVPLTRTINGQALTGDITIATSGSPVWGAIGGTLSSQADLWAALTGKESLSSRCTDFSSFIGIDDTCWNHTNTYPGSYAIKQALLVHFQQNKLSQSTNMTTADSSSDEYFYPSLPAVRGYVSGYAVPLTRTINGQSLSNNIVIPTHSHGNMSNLNSIDQDLGSTSAVNFSTVDSSIYLINGSAAKTDHLTITSSSDTNFYCHLTFINGMLTSRSCDSNPSFH